MLQKQDLAGLSLHGLVKRVRSDRWDLAIASLHSSAVNRSLTSVELLTTSSRARKRFIRLDKDSIIQLTTSQSILELFPKLLFGTIIGVGLAWWTYIYTLYCSSTNGQPKKKKKAQIFQAGQPSVLFLRTDLGGAVQAGGSVSHVKGMIQAFMHAGFNIIYISDSPLQNLPSSVKQIQIKSLPLLDFLDEFQFIHYNLRVIGELGKITRKFQPALFYQRHSVLNFAGGVVARRFKIPLVLEANDSEVWIKKHWSRLTFEKLAIRCETTALQLADRIAVISEGVREQLSPYNIDEKRYIHNPNGVDPEEFHPDIDGSEVRKQYGFGSEIVVGFIGTFTRWHGVETLFDAAEIVAKKNFNIRFLFIGEGDLRTKLQQRAEEADLNTACTFTGLIPHHQAAAHLAACDILVSPHLGFEDGTKFFGSPTKLFEYMAMGKAIIASKLEQIGKVITDGANGLHMTPGNAQQLAELILLLARDGTLRKRLGAQARRDVINKFTWDKNVQRILESLKAG
ncbi:MAG: glycosyltransferase [Ignavibacteriales bacterium]|nr:glycosyltransferase [Ignavibacteriales bacterium]